MIDGPQASPAAPRTRPVERFLGAPHASGGPFALLGLTPQQSGDDFVLGALDRQLERVNSHAQCDTPEADEVRLALHAAAAQLLDPVVRRHLVARWTGAVPMPAVSAPAPAPAQKSDGMRLLEHDAILTLGLLGWNQRSLRRLASLAHARGLGNEQVAVALRNLTRHHSARPRNRAPVRAAPSAHPPLHLAAPPPHEAPAIVKTPPPPPVPEDKPLYEQMDPAQRLLKNAILLGGLGVLAMVGLGVLIVTLGKKPPKPAPPSLVPPLVAAPSGAPGATAPAAGPQIPDTIPTARARTPAPKPNAPAATPSPEDFAAINRELAAAAEAAQVDPVAAAARFEGAVSRLASAWPATPHDRLIAAHDSVLEFVYRASGSAEAEARAISVLAGGAHAVASGPISSDQVLPAVWSLGILVRLSRERDLPGTSRATIDSAITGALGVAHSNADPTFDGGAAAMLYALPQRLLSPAGSSSAGAPAPDLETWQRWADAADAIAGQDAALRARILLAGLESILVLGPEPDKSRATGAVIADLVPRLTWRPDDESRRWLLRWFGDRRISAADLQAVTSALATHSSAEGVDLTMVLSTSASERVRAELRDRYATVWNIKDQLAHDDMAAQWAKAAREAIEASLSSSRDMGQLESAVLLARINDAAWWLWRGDSNEAGGTLADLRGPIEQSRVAAGAGDPALLNMALTDGGWGEKYLAAKQSPKIRHDLLQQMRSTVFYVGPVDAEVIAGEAIYGAAADIRAAATELVHQFASNPSMINALLERLPRIPRLPAAASLIEYVCNRQLPALRDPDWPIEARRALVERLLEALAAESPIARVDRLTLVLAASYRSMVSPTPLSSDQRLEKSQPPAEASASQLWTIWRGAADKVVPIGPPPIRLDQIERRRSGRLSQARGLVQQFGAEQSSLCEVMAYVIASEAPGRTDDVRAILVQLAEDRRRAQSILDQLNAAERAMVRLWLIRLGPAQEPPPA